MKIKTYLTASAFAVSLLTSTTWADTAATTTATTFTQEQVKSLDNIIHQYMINNPEILIEVSKILEKKQQQAQQQQAKTAILTQTDQLLNETLSVAGNPKGNVTLIEFFDYQCIHCKKMKPLINELIQKNPNLRVVYKEFPIFGKNSEDASKIALAAAIQGKYTTLQDALLKVDKPLDEDSILKIAQSAGLNMTKLKADMASKIVADAINANRKLADALHLMGTPAFIILSTPNGQFKPNSEPLFVPGAADLNTLQGFVNKAAE